MLSCHPETFAFEVETQVKRLSYVTEVHPRRRSPMIHGAVVISVADLVPQPRGPLIGSVAGDGPCAHIRGVLAGLGWRETRDFVCTA